MKLAIPGFVYLYHPSWNEEAKWIWSSEKISYEYYTLYGEQSITIEVDPDWDPTDAKLKALRERRVEILATNHKRLKEVDDLIAELLALPAPVR